MYTWEGGWTCVSTYGFRVHLASFIGYVVESLCQVNFQSSTIEGEFMGAFLIFLILHVRYVA